MRVAVGDRLLNDGFDRRKTGTAGEQDDRLAGVVLQAEAAVRAVKAQDVAHLHRGEYLFGEEAAGHVPDVQLQQVVLVGRVGQREAALAAILEQDVDVLAGQELQVFGGRQAQVHVDHIGRQLLHPLDAGGQGLDRDVVRRAQLLAFDDQVGTGVGAAVERQTGGLVGVAQGGGMPVFDGAFEHLALAGAAGAVLAAVGHGQPLAQRGLKQGFIGFGLELAAARLDCHLVAHRSPWSSATMPTCKKS